MLYHASLSVSHMINFRWIEPNDTVTEKGNRENDYIVKNDIEKCTKTIHVGAPLIIAGPWLIISGPQNNYVGPQLIMLGSQL